MICQLWKEVKYFEEQFKFNSISLPVMFKAGQIPYFSESIQGIYSYG